MPVRRSVVRAGTCQNEPVPDHRSELTERIIKLETEMVELRAMTGQFQATIGRWTMALVIAILGAIGTLGGAAVAYGELRQQAATNAELLTEVRGEVREIARAIR